MFWLNKLKSMNDMMLHPESIVLLFRFLPQYRIAGKLSISHYRNLTLVHARSRCNAIWIAFF